MTAWGLVGKRIRSDWLRKRIPEDKAWQRQELTQEQERQLQMELLEWLEEQVVAERAAPEWEDHVPLD